MPNKAKVRLPPLKQPPNEPYCGPTCVKMILDFYGIKYSLKRLVKTLQSKDGVVITKVGIFFLKHNFKVTLSTWWDYFPNRFLDLADDEMEREALSWCRKRNGIKNGADRLFRKTLHQFIGKGGKIITRPPKISEVRAVLMKKNPPILDVEASTLWGARQKIQRTEHMVVPVSISKKTIILNDPSHGQIEVPIDRFLFSFYRSDAGALFLEPPAN